MNELLTGAITGILFGFLMQKAQVIRYDKQLAALRLTDMTIVKFMLTTILVAMVGIYLLFDLGLGCLFNSCQKAAGYYRENGQNHNHT